MSDPVWDKFDRHDEIISVLQQKQAATDARLQAMDERIDRNQHQIVAGMSRLETKVDQGNEWISESRGGLRFGKWIAGIGLTCLAVLATWIKFFKGGG